MTRMSRWLPITLLTVAAGSSLVADEINTDGDSKPEVVADTTSDIASPSVTVATATTPEVVTLQTVTPLLQPAMQPLVQQALDNSPSVQQALADVQKARGLRFQSTRSPNPVAGYMASEVGNDGRAGQQGVFWSQNFRVAEKLDLNSQIGYFDVQATTWNWQVEQARVAGTVQIRWYAAAAAEQ